MLSRRTLRLKTLSRAVTLAALALIAPAAQASFLDTDFWCRTYGCAVVYDSQSYEIYDNWQFNLNLCCVAYGGQMQAYYQNFQSLRVTGTTDRPTSVASDEGFMLGITEDGKDISQSIIDDGDGYLDASDELSAFTLSSLTDVKLDGPGERYSHSFWISSRNINFSLRARASMSKATGDFRDTITLGDIKLATNVQRRGNDNGFDFGSRASDSNVTIVNGIDDLGDMASGPARIIHFGRTSGIRIRNGDFDDQVIRVDFEYTMPNYDLSMGTGEIEIDVEFDFYRELNKKP